MSKTLVKVDDICFERSVEHVVLDGTTFELAAGEKVGLIGPNGCGKTTLLHLIIGLLKPTRGHIIAFGNTRSKESDFHEVRRRMGLVFQDPDDQLFCPTVLEDVAFGPLNLGSTQEEARSIAGDTLDLVGLKGFEDRITYKLSGGEKRLVALASVLAMSPEVLLLDEPTGGLDNLSKEHISSVLKDLSQAMIIVSHENDFILELSTRTIDIWGNPINPDFSVV